MRTAFNIAGVAMAFADGRAAIRAAQAKTARQAIYNFVIPVTFTRANP